MFALRSLVFVELLLCIVLYATKKMNWNPINDLAIMDWVFMFAYPMAYLVLILMLVLVIKDIILFLKTKKNIYMVWGAIDFSIPILSYIIFEQYYSLIGHM